MSSCYSSGAVQSVLLASACKSFEAGVDGWLSADSGVRVSRAGSETDHNQQQYLFLYIISLLLFRYLRYLIRCK